MVTKKIILKKFGLDMSRNVKGGIQFTRDYTRAKTKANAIKLFSKKYKTKVKSREVY